ncbi:ABC transporter C family member [Arachis hypogaea]|nr:ABC transporter C family member [Arachis hypogaea]
MRRQKLCEGVQVKDVRWNAELGGQNMKLRLVEHFADEFNKQVGGGIDVRKFPKAMAKLKKQVKRQKKFLVQTQRLLFQLNHLITLFLVRYRPNTPLVLKGITLSIYGGEKIGVAGRTGSGKSTLIQVFFRLVEPSGGKIIIDGTDISVLGLHDLRSCFGIIPQEPVLFEGTVRSNIDLTGQYTNEDIWKSLERCQLKEAVSAKPEKLDSLVVDNGENWSVGQRQLLCSGRVMLKQSRILFMDEVFKLSTARSA